MHIAVDWTEGSPDGSWIDELKDTEGAAADVVWNVLDSVATVTAMGWTKVVSGSMGGVPDEGLAELDCTVGGVVLNAE